MKINASVGLERKSNQLSERKKNINLTGFGIQNESNDTELISKDTASALRTNCFTNISFGGRVKNIVTGPVGTSGAIAISEQPCEDFKENGSIARLKHWIGGSYNNNNHLRVMIRERTTDRYRGFVINTYEDEDATMENLIRLDNWYYPNSSIERLHGRINDYKTNRIYFADPEEVVNDQTKRDHDFIVYDNKPYFPRFHEVKEEYFNTHKKSSGYNLYFKSLAEYYSRLKKADLIELNRLEERKQKVSENYEKSLKYRNILAETEEDIPWNKNENNKEKAESEYYFSQNERELNEVNQKIGYYNQRIERSKKQIANAIEGKNILDEVAPMLYERDRAIDELNGNKRSLAYNTEAVALNEQKLKECENSRDTLTEQLETAKKWKDDAEQRLLTPEPDIPSHYSTYYDAMREHRNLLEEAEKDKEFFTKKIYVINSELARVEKKINEYNKILEERKSYKKKAEQTIPLLEKRIDDVSNKIKDLYFKIEEFYKKIEDWQFE